jgi:F-type H+-transporting ATPase subunit a
MDINQISPDQVVYWAWGFVQINATIIYTWLTMLILTGAAWLGTRNLTSKGKPSRWQNILEMFVSFLRREIREISHEKPDRYIALIGTLFLFIVVANLCAVVPGYLPPTASLSTTAALALCVFIAVPVYGIGSQGVKGYLREYIRPTPVMLPFNIIGELSRTLALAVRLFGNVMSTVKIGGILLALAPFFFPVVLNVLGLITGLIQAYIFAILAAVFIASASHARRQREEEHEAEEKETS